MRYSVMFKMPDVLDQLEERKHDPKDPECLEIWTASEIEEHNQNVEKAKELLKKYLEYSECINVAIDIETEEVYLKKR